MITETFKRAGIYLKNISLPYSPTQHTQRIDPNTKSKSPSPLLPVGQFISSTCTPLLLFFNPLRSTNFHVHKTMTGNVNVVLPRLPFFDSEKLFTLCTFTHPHTHIVSTYEDTGRSRGEVERTQVWRVMQNTWYILSHWHK